MELRIGMQHAPREITLETEQSAAEVEALVQQAYTDGAALIRLVDDKQRVYLLRTEQLQYLEISAEEPRRVGFIA